MNKRFSETVKCDGADFCGYYHARNCMLWGAVEHVIHPIVESVRENIQEMDYQFDPDDRDSVY